MVSWGLIYGFFRVSYQDFLSGFLWVSPRVFLGFDLGYKQERMKQKKIKNKETVKTGSEEAEEQEVEQQKHMTKEKRT